jgi:hypothetical protein
MADETGTSEPTAEPAAATAAAAAAPAAAPPATSDLLNMFEASQVQAEDYSVLLALAPDVAIQDLVEDLHLVASALGLRDTVREYAHAA